MLRSFYRFTSLLKEKHLFNWQLLLTSLFICIHSMLFLIDSYFWLLCLYISIPCYLTAWYKLKLKSKVVFIVLIYTTRTYDIFTKAHWYRGILLIPLISDFWKSWKFGIKPFPGRTCSRAFMISSGVPGSC